MEVEVTAIVRDEGTLVLFQGVPLALDAPPLVTFAVDHRPAQELIEALAEDEEVIAIVEPYQIVGRQ